MTSIMTNTAAMAALQTLRTINSDLEMTQARISSGYRVETASDNAAYWSIATTMRSDNKALSTVSDALGLGAAKVDVAYTGMNSAIEVVDEIKSKLVAAAEPGVDKDKINSELTELKNQLVSIAESASFSGENWLLNTSTTAPSTASIVGSFNRSSAGNVSIATLDVDISSSTLIDTDNAGRGILTQDIDADALLDAPTGTSANYFLIDASSTTAATGTEITLSAATTDAEVEAMIRVVDSILLTLTDSASDLGAINSRVGMQETFVSKPDGLDQQGNRPIGRRRHERGIDQTDRAADPAAAWYPGPVDRQLQLSEHPVAVPVRTDRVPTPGPMTGAPEPPGRPIHSIKSRAIPWRGFFRCPLVSPALNRLVMQLNNLLPPVKGLLTINSVFLITEWWVDPVHRTGSAGMRHSRHRRRTACRDSYLSKGGQNDQYHDQRRCNGGSSDAPQHQFRSGDDAGAHLLRIPCGNGWRQRRPIGRLPPQCVRTTRRSRRSAMHSGLAHPRSTLPIPA